MASNLKEFSVSIRVETIVRASSLLAAEDLARTLGEMAAQAARTPECDEPDLETDIQEVSP